MIKISKKSEKKKGGLRSPRPPTPPPTKSTYAWYCSHLSCTPLTSCLYLLAQSRSSRIKVSPSNIPNTVNKQATLTHRTRSVQAILLNVHVYDIILNTMSSISRGKDMQMIFKRIATLCGMLMSFLLRRTSLGQMFLNIVFLIELFICGICPPPSPWIFAFHLQLVYLNLE